jgi:4,5-dihydroxyphthalate decarboxylase
MTEAITLHAAIADYPHVQAVKRNTVGADRIRWDFEDVPNITRAFRRMVRTLDFDVCEIALTTLAQAKAAEVPIIGLPVVVMRGFHHGALVCRQDSPITGPQDLIGKRVGVRAWSQTTGVWVRGILLEEYGVDHRQTTWITAEDAHVASYVDPPNVQRIADGADLPTMLLSGEIDAAIALGGLPAGATRPVIADAEQAAAAWFGRTGIYPVNHLLCLKTALLDANPWLGETVMALFAKAKRAAPGPSNEARFAPIVGADTLPYGLDANRPGIERCLAYAAEQGLVPRVYRPEQVVISP